MVFKLFINYNIAILPIKFFVIYLLIKLLGFRVNGLGFITTKSRVKAFC